MALPLTPKPDPANSWAPTNSPFPVPPRPSLSPGIPGHPGSGFATPLTIPFASFDSSSSVSRPNMPNLPSPNPSMQQPTYHAYPSVPPMVASPQAHWQHHSHMGVLSRPPFLPHPATYPGSFSPMIHVMPLPSVSSFDPQPPGVSSFITPGSAAASLGHQLAGTTVMARQTELPPGIDKMKPSQDITEKVASNEQAEAWTVHKSDAGVLYYYNAITKQSTYVKPLCLEKELDNVPLQSTPVSMEYLAGTNWALVTTNDRKRYYHNSITKLSSWQVPTEIAEVKVKQEVEISSEHQASASNTTALPEKVSVSLSAPAVGTGGRDAIALRNPCVLGSSALDLIKKKLQDNGSPLASSSAQSASSLFGTVALELNGSKGVEAAARAPQSESSKDKLKESNDDCNLSDSSSESEDTYTGPTKEECIIQFKEMLKERGIVPFSKWEKELPKIVFDPRFKAIPSQDARRSIFEHYVKTRAEEERKEKRAAQKAAVEGFKQLLQEASEDIDQDTDYQSFRKKWDSDPRFDALDRKEREHLLIERVLPLKRAAEEKAKSIRAAAASSFNSMLHERGDITVLSRWSKVKDDLRNDPRYRSVKHEDREVLFNEYISKLKSVEEEAQREEKVKQEEQEKLKEREREFRKRKEREEQEMERIRLKVRRKENIESFQALLVETIKDPQASWTESKAKLEKDPQGRATNPGVAPSDMEKLFREHTKTLYERCLYDFRALLSEVITPEAAAQESEDGKTVVDSWSTAKRIIKPDTRYSKMPRKDREAVWRRHADDLLRKQKSAVDQKEEKNSEAKSRTFVDSSRSRRSNDRR